MEMNIEDNGKMIKSMVLVCTLGQTEEDIRAVFNLIFVTVVEFIHGLMVQNMMETMKMI